jgi:hypothetical protein
MNIYDRSSVGGHIGKLNALTSKLISDCTRIALDCVDFALEAVLGTVEEPALTLPQSLVIF